MIYGESIILPGITIGAGSVVVKSKPSNTVACGNQCRIIRENN